MRTQLTGEESERLAEHLGQRRGVDTIADRGDDAVRLGRAEAHVRERRPQAVLVIARRAGRNVPSPARRPSAPRRQRPSWHQTIGGRLGRRLNTL
jgi:hypothetical protein